VLRRPVFPEQVPGHQVHPCVGALGAEYRSDEELERALVVQRALRVGIAGLEPLDDRPDPLGSRKFPRSCRSLRGAPGGLSHFPVAFLSTCSRKPSTSRVLRTWGAVSHAFRAIPTPTSVFPIARVL